MKRFLKKVFIYFFVTVALTFISCIVVDRFNVFHPLNIRDNGVEPNKNYIKMYYLLRNPDKFDTFIFGSSHVSVMNPQKISDKCYNAYYSGALCGENLLSLKTLISNGIIPKKIYVGADCLSYVVREEDRHTERLRVSYEYSRSNPFDFWMLYLDPVVNLKAVKDVINGHGITNDWYDSEFYNYGVKVSNITEPDMRGMDIQADVDNSHSEMIEYLARTENYPDNSGYLQYQVKCLGEIKNICDENGIECTIFVNPMYFEQYADAVENKAFLSFLRQLAELTPYYNFSGFNKYTTNPQYYYSDRSHYGPELGEIVIDAIVNDIVDEEALSQGFGMYVTEENVDELITLLAR